MCGIAGYVDFGKTGPILGTLQAMAATLRRRGPDDHGVLVDGACGLAHARLSVIDVAGSPQPMRAAGTRISLTYNGELYNYQELRTGLRERGHDLQSAGDTEALLRWIDLEWDAALPRLDGMFAFGAWDRVGRRLLLARDPLGKKPLFYAMPAPGLIVFGSEIKALLVHPAVARELDEDSLRQVIRFRAVYGSGSLYKGIRQVEPGCWVEFGVEGLRTGQHYDLLASAQVERERQRGLTAQGAVAQFGALLEASVRKRLVADVPVGAFLSGGLDSSAIVSVMRSVRTAGEPIRTFSVGFRGDDRSELPFARLVSTAVGTTHTEVSLSEADYASMLIELTGCRDAPLSEPADPAIARMSEVAKQTVKVVLSGEGSDEAFGGYPKYMLARAPGFIGAAIRMVGSSRSAAIAGGIGLDRRRALVALQSMSKRTELERLVQWFSYLDIEALRGLLPGLGWTPSQWDATMESQRTSLARARVAGCRGAFARMQAVDCLTWLPGNLLERGDRMTMSAGLEMRVPFLDKALVPFGIALADRFKVRGRRLKWVVRQWAEGRLPQEVLHRKKWGFRVPLAEWFRGSLRPLLHDSLTASNGLCGRFGDVAVVRKLLEAHQRSDVDASMELWTLLSAEVWFQNVFSPAGVGVGATTHEPRNVHVLPTNA